jgi:hypothetical protein
MNDIGISTRKPDPVARASIGHVVLPVAVIPFGC